MLKRPLVANCNSVNVKKLEDINKLWERDNEGIRNKEFVLCLQTKMTKTLSIKI